MTWWSRTLAFILAAGWVALVGAFLWVLWADGTQYIDLGDLEFRFEFSGGDLERTLASIVGVAIGVAALYFLANVVFGLGTRRKYHQMLRSDGTQLLVDTDIVSERMADAARRVPGVRKAIATARPATNNEVHAALDLEVYPDADPAATAQQASQVAVDALQQHFETRPSGGLRTQVRQRGKPQGKGKTEPAKTDETVKPGASPSDESAEPTREEPVVEPATEEPPIHEGAEEESEP